MSTMFKNFALTFLILITLLPSVAMAGSCSQPDQSAVTASISTETLSAVSGADLPLHILLKNHTDKDFKEGVLFVTVTREARPGDFSQGNSFVVAQGIAKSNIELLANSEQKLSFVWNIPAVLPGGVYRADALFIQDNKNFNNLSAVSNSPFGNSAKVVVNGEKIGAAFFIEGTNNNKEPSIVFVNTTKKEVNLPVTIKTYKGSLAGDLINSESKTISVATGSSTVIEFTKPTEKYYTVTAETEYLDIPAFYFYSFASTDECSDLTDLYPWAVFIGGLGVVVFVLLFVRKKSKSDSALPSSSQPNPVQPSPTITNVNNNQ